jgi:cytochrome-b5 reductase
MWKSLAGCVFGSVAASTFASPSNSTAAPATAAAAAAPGPLSPDEFRPLRLVSSQYETHDTRRFVFGFSDSADAYTYPLTSCVLLKYHDELQKQDVVRPYTPISISGKKGTLEILVKRYPKAKMGQHLHTLRPGETCEFKGPFTKLPYKAGLFSHVGMIAGGTGISPMYQLLRGIVENPADKTRVSLIYSNHSRKDLVLANELCEMQKTYPNFHLYLTLTQESPKRWLGGVGRITAEMMKPFLPKPGEKNTIVLVCGPSSFMAAISGDKDFSKKGAPPAQGVLSGVLKDMGYTEQQVFKF